MINPRPACEPVAVMIGPSVKPSEDCEETFPAMDTLPEAFPAWPMESTFPS